MRSIWVILATTLIGLLFCESSFAQNADSIVRRTEWLNDHTVKIKTDFYSSSEDLQPLLTILKDKRLVSVGEATHGTKEFAQIKCRLFKFLVEQMGFTVFALEADFSAALAVNRYIQGIETDGIKALQGLRFFHCVNEETLTLIHWMKEYNDQQTDDKHKVKFYGFDFGFPDMALKELARIIAKSDSTKAAKIELVEPAHSPHFGFYLDYVQMGDLEMIHDLLNSNSTKHDMSQSDFHLAMQLLNVLQQDHRLNSGGGIQDSVNARDPAMKKNIDWILNSEGRGTKIMLWSHNDHARYGTIESIKGDIWNGMGMALKKEYGAQVYTIAFDFNKGKFYSNFVSLNREMKFTVFEVGDAPADMLAWQMSKVNKEAFFLDFGEVKDNSAIQAWLVQTSKLRVFGGALFEADDSLKDLNNFYGHYKLSSAFDGLFFVNNTHETTPLKK